jgi:hypothetical protein
MNITGHVIIDSRTGDPIEFLTFQISRDGIPVDETTRFKKMHGIGLAPGEVFLSGMGGPSVVKLKPGESCNSIVNVSNYYDMSKPGTYSVTVSRESPPGLPEESPTVKSNTITITVLPADDPPPAPEKMQSVLPPPPPPQPIKKPEPEFALSIEEDRDAARTNPGLHRVLVKYTHISFGFEHEQYHEEAMGMYQMVVLRNGAPVAETDAMRDLRKFRKMEFDPTILNPRMLKTGESWITPLDVSDYYDMTKPGTYQITVLRETEPYAPNYSVTVSSNTIIIVVHRKAGGHSAQSAEKPKARFALTLSPEYPDDVPPNVVEVVMENTSNSTIRERKCWPFFGMYNFVVLRNGEPLEENDEMRNLQKGRAGVDCPDSETISEIEPGSNQGDRVPLGAFYDIHEPGSYSVYVTRETYPYIPAKSVLVESNTISFVVPEPSPQPANDASPADKAQPAQSPQ